MTQDELREYTEEWRDFGYLFIRARWTMDGATTLTEAGNVFAIARRGSSSSPAPDSSSISRPTNGFAVAVRPGEESPMRLVEEVE